MVSTTPIAKQHCGAEMIARDCDFVLLGRTQQLTRSLVARQSQQWQSRGGPDDGTRSDSLRPQASAVEEASTSREEAPLVFPWQGRRDSSGGNGSHGASTSQDHTAAIETLKQKGVRVRVSVCFCFVPWGRGG
jgi:hypothetical protein